MTTEEACKIIIEKADEILELGNGLPYGWVLARVVEIRDLARCPLNET